MAHGGGVAALLEDVDESVDVAADVGAGIFDGVAHTGLGGEIDDDIGLLGGEEAVDGLLVLEIDADE